MRGNEEDRRLIIFVWGLLIGHSQHITAGDVNTEDGATGTGVLHSTATAYYPSSPLSLRKPSSGTTVKRSSEKQCGNRHRDALNESTAG